MTPLLATIVVILPSAMGLVINASIVETAWAVVNLWLQVVEGILNCQVQVKASD